MGDKSIEAAYPLAKERYAEAGVGTEASLMDAVRGYQTDILNRRV